MTQRASGAAIRLTWRWDIVWLGRLAGAFVIASALAPAIWDAVGIYDAYSAPLKLRLFDLWYTFVNVAWGGAAIIVLAELVNLLSGRDALTLALRDRGEVRHRRGA